MQGLNDILLNDTLETLKLVLSEARNQIEALEQHTDDMLYTRFEFLCVIISVFTIVLNM